MTHLLTIMWLGVWIGAQLLCYRLRASSTFGRREYWRTAILVSCLTIILFPVISTDDDAAWARQIQVDFESAGVTQATRALSRYDLPADLLASSVLFVLCPRPVANLLYGTLALEGAPVLVIPFLRAADVLRGPPSLR